MRTHALVIALVLAGLLACKKKRADETPLPSTPTSAATSTADAAAPSDTWTTFKSEAGKFELLTPISMNEETKATPTAAGSMDMHMFTATYLTVSYQVNYTDMPANIVKAAGPDKLLKGGEDGAMKAINATAQTSKKFKVQTYPAREFSTVASVQGVDLDYFSRVILAKNRLYQLQVIGPKGKVSDSNRSKFIESFKISK